MLKMCENNLTKCETKKGDVIKVAQPKCFENEQVKTEKNKDEERIASESAGWDNGSVVNQHYMKRRGPIVL